ncbi:MAG: vitamin K epoxide reductase [Chloroflexi bacterium]|nr:vitamin K epoxide reductase [Chloroflexota bacterium]
MLRLAAVIALLLSHAAASAKSPVVHAVLFFSPSCPVCNQVMEEILPGVLAEYGPSLSILGINVSFPEGLELYKAAVVQYAIPEDRLGVPALILGDRVLVGKVEIPENLPALTDQALASGGLDYPAIPGLQTALDALAAAEADSWAVVLTPAALAPAPSGPLQKFALDPAGNSLAVAVLIVLSVVLTLVIVRLLRGAQPRPFPAWIFPLLSLAGLAVSLYLSYSAVTHTDAVCGPVGHCNVVQHSAYSTLIGGIPNGILGAAGYLTMLLLWLWIARLSAAAVRIPSLLLWGILLAAALFSTFLTFLEPFVIGASCIWCLASTVIVAALLWLSTENLLKTWFAPAPAG